MKIVLQDHKGESQEIEVEEHGKGIYIDKDGNIYQITKLELSLDF